MSPALSAVAERALVFGCEGDALVGVLAVPPRPASLGVVILAGGPQYRAGSHRQFTLLARELAAQGTPTLRFDYRGMGDAQGAPRSFLDVRADIACAIDALVREASSVRRVVLWGLCDAASAAMLYGQHDPRVAGLVLANPWVRTEAGQARAQVAEYYPRRLLQADLWRKLLRGELDVIRSSRAFARALLAGRRAQRESAASFPQRMLEGLQGFPGRTLLLLSGDDLTAAEFKALASGSPQWRSTLAAERVERRELPAANHTFSRREWRDEVARMTREWLATV
ncbi:MAG: hydrolase 1, exosortase A system-associated [Betaproteobacteria bacterium]